MGLRSNESLLVQQYNLKDWRVIYLSLNSSSLISRRLNTVVYNSPEDLFLCSKNLT